MKLLKLTIIVFILCWSAISLVSSDRLGGFCHFELPGDAGPGSGGLLGHDLLHELGFLLDGNGVDKIAGLFDDDSADGVLARGSRLDGFILLKN